jgi:hypothetical protein
MDSVNAPAISIEHDRKDFIKSITINGKKSTIRSKRDFENLLNKTSSVSKEHWLQILSQEMTKNSNKTQKAILKDQISLLQKQIDGGTKQKTDNKKVVVDVKKHKAAQGVDSNKANITRLMVESDQAQKFIKKITDLVKDGWESSQTDLKARRERLKVRQGREKTGSDAVSTYSEMINYTKSINSSGLFQVIDDQSNYTYFGTILKFAFAALDDATAYARAAPHSSDDKEKIIFQLAKLMDMINNLNPTAVDKKFVDAAIRDCYKTSLYSSQPAEALEMLIERFAARLGLEHMEMVEKELNYRVFQQI